MGLVGDNFSRREVIDRLPGTTAVGHVRYSTTGETILRNVQPLFAELEGGGFAIGHNGNLTNGLALRRAAGRRRRDDAVDHRHRGDPASGRARQAQPLRRPLHRGPAPARRRLCLRRHDQQEADRRPRPARHPPAGARPARRLPDARLGDLRARHHRREVRARRRERRGAWCSTRTARIRTSRSRRWRRGPASSSTSISPAPTPSSAAARSTTCARHGRAARHAKRRPTPTSSCRCRIPACPRRSASRRPPAFPTSSASSATTTSAAPSSSRPSRSAQLGVRLKHSANRAVVERQAHRAGRQLHRARHHLDQDRADDARRRRDGGALPHLLAADHASGLLRHRHAGARQAARRDPRPRGHARSSSARTRSPSSRSRASTRRWATRRAIRCGRSSPTTASPANIRPASPTRPASRPAAAVVAARGSGLRVRCYIRQMTKLLEQAIETARRLSADEQDDIARAILELAGKAICRLFR